MGTLTAFIYIGTSHPNHSGIIPTHFITLSENDRPCLQLKSIDTNKEIISIIPTIENMIDDIHFIVYSFVLEKGYTDLNYHLKEMSQLFTEEERKKIYEEVKKGLQNMDIKIVFNILDGSSLLNKLDSIKLYPNDYEVTTPVLKKEYSHWTQKTEIKEYT
jgi:hypothetical protein